MYRKLTDNQVKELGRNLLYGTHFIISHVGDGEYTCNVFGNVYSSHWRALKKAREKMPNSPVNIYIRDDDRKDIFICDGDSDTYPDYWRLPKIALLTVERINSDFDLGQ